MSTQNPVEVQRRLRELAKESMPTTGGRELVFDPATGKLLVTQPGERPSPDAQVATAIAKDGFFRG
jgi:hypothetical protein